MTPLKKKKKKTDIKKNWKITINKYSELVNPVNNKGGASVTNPEGPHDGQEQREAGWEQAEDLVREAHGLGRGQSRVPHLQNAIAGRQCLLQAAVLSYEVLIKINFSLLHTKLRKIIKNLYIKVETNTKGKNALHL